MNRIALTCSILVLFTPPALAEGDEEILERVRVLVTATFQEEIAGKLPESFTESGLAPSDRKRLIDQLADDYVSCFQGAIVEYAATNGLELSELVSPDGSVGFKGDSGTDFSQLLVPCIQTARQAAGFVH